MRLGRNLLHSFQREGSLHATQTGEDIRVVRRQKTRAQVLTFIGVSQGKTRFGRINSLGLASLIPPGFGVIMLFPSFLLPGPGMI